MGFTFSRWYGDLIKTKGGILVSFFKFVIPHICPTPYNFSIAVSLIFVQGQEDPINGHLTPLYQLFQNTVEAFRNIVSNSRIWVVQILLFYYKFNTMYQDVILHVGVEVIHYSSAPLCCFKFTIFQIVLFIVRV